MFGVRNGCPRVKTMIEKNLFLLLGRLSQYETYPLESANLPRNQTSIPWCDRVYATIFVTLRG